MVSTTNGIAPVYTEGQFSFKVVTNNMPISTNNKTREVTKERKYKKQTIEFMKKLKSTENFRN